jgi:uncharacterized membrane protein
MEPTMSATSNTATSAPPSRSFSWAGFFLGFAFSGFFDGILLHQVLQWHHLLSAVDGPRFRSVELQIFADGLFHVAMYLIAIIGLWLLWRTRREYAAAVSGRRLVASALIGFGSWHIVDGILSHWVLGIHRIRMDTDMPLFWDLLWFFLFGVAFVAAGWRMRRQDSDTGSSNGGTATAWLLALAVMAAAPLASLPPANITTALVFFRPGTAPLEIFRAIDLAEARILWSSSSGTVWALDLKKSRRPDLFYRHGAYLVSNSAAAIGCLAWSTVRARNGS